MRPDRIIVGEVRGAEALDMLQAMNTGHDGSLSTVHANTPRDALGRLETMVMMSGFEIPLRAVRQQISAALDLILQIERLEDGRRHVTAITEVQRMEVDVITLQELFTYKIEQVTGEGVVVGRLDRPSSDLLAQVREAGRPAACRALPRAVRRAARPPARAMRALARLAPGLIAFLSVFAASAGVASAAGSIGLVAARATFPDRSYIVTLPSPRVLSASDVQVTENGVGVDNLALAREGTATAGRSDVVLVIDESLTMKGAPIAAAFAAARAFAARANPEEAIAVVTFNGSVQVLQPFTVSAAAIDRALSRPARIAYGTKNYDALDKALGMLTAANVSSGSVIILTDGQSVGNVLQPTKVVKDLAQAHVRVFSVGLKSPAFTPTPLEQLASATGGAYVLATGPAKLRPILVALGNRLSSEYLLTYRSLAYLGTPVVVRVTINGVPGYAATGYSSPALSLSAPPPYTPSKLDRAIRSRYTLVFVALAFAILIGFAVTHVLAARTGGVERVGDFVSIQRRADGVPAQVAESAVASAPGLLAQLAANTRRRGWMDRLATTLELADVQATPIQVVLLTLMGTFLVMMILLIAIGALGLLLGLVTPLFVRMLIRRRIATKRKKFAAQLPDNLDVLASALRAGHSLVGALSVVADDAPEPSKSEFQRVLAEEQFGVQLEDAFKVAVVRMESADLDQVALVSRLQREMGSNSAEVLDRVIDTVRSRMELRRLVSTLTAQGRMSRWLLTALPIFLAVVMTVISPGYMRPLFHNTLGEALLILAACMVSFGSWIIGKIIDIKI